jgi:hypothetical protein
MISLSTSALERFARRGTRCQARNRLIEAAERELCACFNQSASDRIVHDRAAAGAKVNKYLFENSPFGPQGLFKEIDSAIPSALCSRTIWSTIFWIASR